MFNGNIVQKSTTITKYIKKHTNICDSSSFLPKDSLTNSLEMRTKLMCFKLSVNPLWKVPFTPGVSSLSLNRVILLLNVIQKCVYNNWYKLLRSPCVFWFVIVLKNEPNSSKIHGMFWHRAKRRWTLFSPDSFLMRFRGTHLHLHAARSSASCYKFCRVFPTFKASGE